VDKPLWMVGKKNQMVVAGAAAAVSAAAVDAAALAAIAALVDPLGCPAFFSSLVSWWSLLSVPTAGSRCSTVVA
jgi:hypothetical protein